MSIFTKKYRNIASNLINNGEYELAFVVIEKGLSKFKRSKKLWNRFEDIAGNSMSTTLLQRGLQQRAQIFDDRNLLFQLKYEELYTSSKEAAFEYLINSVNDPSIDQQVIFSKIKKMMEKNFANTLPYLERLPLLNIPDYYLGMLQLYGHCGQTDEELMTCRHIIEDCPPLKSNQPFIDTVKSRYTSLLRRQKICKKHYDIENTPRPKVAFCISGQFRIPLHSLKENIEALRSHCDCDFFISSWSTSSDLIPADIFDPKWRPKVFARSLPKRFSIRVLRLSSKVFFRKFPSLVSVARDYKAPEAISSEEIQTIIQPTDFVISDEQKITEELMARHNPRNTDELNQYKMYYNIKRCNDLKRKYECKHEFEYDLVVRLRPDFSLSGTFSPQDFPLTPHRVYVDYLNIGRMADAQGIGSSERMDHYAEMWSILSKGIERVDIPGFRKRIIAHELIFDHMWLDGVDLIYKKFPFCSLMLPEYVSSDKILPGLLDDVARRLCFTSDDRLDLEAIIKDFAEECNDQVELFVSTLKKLRSVGTHVGIGQMLADFIDVAANDFPSKVFSFSTVTNQEINPYSSVTQEEIERYISRSLSEAVTSREDILPFYKFLGGKDNIVSNFAKYFAKN